MDNCQKDAENREHWRARAIGENNVVSGSDVRAGLDGARWNCRWRSFIKRAASTGGP